jgi:hypothetical protein
MPEKGICLGLGQVASQTSISLPVFVVLASFLKASIYSAFTVCQAFNFFNNLMMQLLPLLYR